MRHNQQIATVNFCLGQYIKEPIVENLYNSNINLRKNRKEFIRRELTKIDTKCMHRKVIHCGLCETYET